MAAISTPAAAQSAGGPVYSRVRRGAADWNRRPGYWHQGGFATGWSGGFYGGFFAPPIVSGSWYARPYPTHLDYRLMLSPQAVHVAPAYAMPAYAADSSAGTASVSGRPPLELEVEQVELEPEPSQPSASRDSSETEGSNVASPSMLFEESAEDVPTPTPLGD